MPNSSADKGRTPASVSTAEFRSRLAWYSEASVFRQRSDFRDKVLTQGRALQAFPMVTEVETCMADLLKGKSRLFDSRAGHAVNLRPEYGAIRSVVLAANRLARKCIHVARDAMSRAASVESLTYIVEGEFEVDFAGVTRRTVFSPAYLDWASAVMDLPLRGQQSIRDYCEAEVHWWRQTDENDCRSDASAGEPVEIDLEQLRFDAARDIEQQIQCMSVQAKDLIERRDAPIQGDWSWLKPWSLGAVAWPFPGRLDGNETQDFLATEADHWDAIGQALSWLPHDGFVGPKVPTRDSDAGYIVAIDSWATCLEAGLTLRYLGGVLRACFQPQPEKVCDKCYRHVGPDLRRRCRLHQARSSERGLALRLDQISDQYFNRLAALRRTLSQDPVYCDPTTSLSTCWRLHPGEQYAYVGRRNPVLNGRWPALPPRDAAARLAAGLACMIDRLEPVSGPLLQERLLKLAEKVVADVDRAISDADSDEPESQPVVGQRMRISVDDALKALTPPGFFALWFSGIGARDAAAIDLVGADPDHPFVLKPVNSKRRGKRSKQEAAAVGNIYGFSLAATVHHLIRHRAWVEAGGEVADHAIRMGQPVALSKTRQLIDVVQARRLKDGGMPYRKIGALFGVSGPAIHKALNK